MNVESSLFIISLYWPFNMSHTLCGKSEPKISSNWGKIW